eukprot:scaffold14366_cov27-Tisochrysis_lutea.AAC.1
MQGARTRKPSPCAPSACSSSLPPPVSSCHSHELLPGSSRPWAPEGAPTPRSVRSFTLRKLVPLLAVLALLSCGFGTTRLARRCTRPSGPSSQWRPPAQRPHLLASGVHGASFCPPAARATRSSPRAAHRDVPLLPPLGAGIISLGTRTRVGASVYSSSSLAAGYGGVSVPSAAAASFSDGLPPGSAQLTTGISPASWGAASEDARLPSTTGSASATGALGGVAGRAEAGAGGAAGGPGGTVTDAGRRAARADGATSSFLDPYAHLSAADAIATSGSTSVEFDENGRRIRHKRSDEEGFVAFNHPPKREEPTGGASNRSHVDRTVHRSRAGAAAGTSVGRPPPPPMTTADRLRLRYRSRKFLFPLLDQGPNNQYLQFRVALAKARALNRTLVLPLWLPHNPKFLHLHPGAPPEPSRDKATDGLAFPAPAPSSRYFMRGGPLLWPSGPHGRSSDIPGAQRRQARAVPVPRRDPYGRLGFRLVSEALGARVREFHLHFRGAEGEVAGFADEIPRLPLF